MSTKCRRLVLHGLLTAVLATILCTLSLGTATAQSGTDFAGTVLMVDPGAGKLSVKKDGTRFTFVINDKTQFDGPGLKSLKDVKKGDSVTVQYVVTGSQYIAQKVTAAKK
ncbi:MAG: hypothetical protein HY581_01990 [Nitrospirae bacterium]|nr:hypothetical protein [Nitrospirota bacterium]